MRGGFQVRSPVVAVALIAYALVGSIKARVAGYRHAARTATSHVEKPKAEAPPTSWLLWRGGPAQDGARALA